MPKFKNGLAKVGRFYYFKFQGKDGKPYHGSTGCETRAAAEMVLRQKREDAALRALGIQPASDAPTLAAVATEWHKAQVLRKGEGTTHARNVTGHVAAYMAELQDLRVSEITQAHAQRMVDAYLQVPGNSAGGVNVVLRSLGLLLGFAVERGYLVKRPFKVRFEDVQDKPKPWISAERMAEFFATLQAQGTPLRAQRLCWLMMTMGLRESEARHARVEHTDLVNLWHIPYDPDVGTKGGEAEPVPIFPWALAEIAATVAGRTQGLLVPGRFPSRAVGRGYTLPYVAAAGAAMGIPGLTPHCLRGTYATLLSLEGAQVKAIQKAMRHKDPRTTEIYIRPVMQSVRDAGARVGEKAGFSESASTWLAQPPRKQRQRKQS